MKQRNYQIITPDTNKPLEQRSHRFTSLKTSLWLRSRARNKQNYRRKSSLQSRDTQPKRRKKREKKGILVGREIPSNIPVSTIWSDDDMTFEQKEQIPFEPKKKLGRRKRENNKETTIRLIVIKTKKYWIAMRVIFQTENIEINYSLNWNDGIQIHLE